MASNYFYLTLDSTAPSNISLSIDGGATYATNQLVTLSIGTTDSETTGYQMKIWSSGVDAIYDSNIQDSETNSSWITFNNSKQIKLNETEGLKTVYLKIRDDVHNESAQVSDSITLDMSKPTVSVSNPDVSKVSKIEGKNKASFSFTVDKEFVEYKVKIVSATNGAESTGAVIGTTNGSTNTSGTGTFAAGTPIVVQITGADIQAASNSDGQKIVKCFCKDASGKWSA